MSYQINPSAKRINSNGSNGESGLLSRVLSPLKKRFTALDVGIVGFGVVGSSTANGFKELGHNVYINDVKDLSEYRDQFHVLQPYDISQTDATFLILPTPTRPLSPGGKIDLSAYSSVIRDLGEQLRKHDQYHVFVVRSTVPPGTTGEMGRELEKISGKRVGEEFGLAMNPEFLRAYNAEYDFINPKLVVIGEFDKRSGDVVERIYAPLEDKIRRESEIEMKLTQTLEESIDRFFPNLDVMTREKILARYPEPEKPI